MNTEEAHSDEDNVATVNSGSRYIGQPEPYGENK